jgi:chaperonin GroEL (HSP60 family)
MVAAGANPMMIKHGIETATQIVSKVIKEDHHEKHNSNSTGGNPADASCRS